MEIIHLHEIDSTNNYAKNNYQHLASHAAIYADKQTQGKGRRGHSWESGVNKNLTVSFLFKDVCNIQEAWTYTMMGAKAVIEVLKYYNIEAKVKWPNDIYVGHQKICGILTETILNPDYCGIVVGIGLNINAAHPYTCMKDLTGKQYSVEEVLHVLIDAFEHALTVPFSKHLDDLNCCSYLKDKKVQYKHYGCVTFTKLLEEGMIEFEDEQGHTYKQVLNEISLSMSEY